MFSILEGKNHPKSLTNIYKLVENYRYIKMYSIFLITDIKTDFHNDDTMQIIY